MKSESIEERISKTNRYETVQLFIYSMIVPKQELENQNGNMEKVKKQNAKT